VAGNRNDFYRTLTAAVADLVEHGFDSQERLDEWLERIHAAARAALVSERVLQRSLADALTRVFRRATSPGQVARRHRGVSQFTLQQIAPRLRAELDRRILASANLIKLNREQSIARTLQRFAGWASSIPAGGTEVAKREKAKKDIRRGIAGLPYEERRVVIDQGAKLAAGLDDIIATDGGAIAGVWHHVPEGPPAYAARPQHVSRNGKVYLLRDSWAQKDGLVKAGAAGYTDEITQPGEEVFCRCRYVFLYNLRDLPPAMLTVKGRATLAEARAKIRDSERHLHAQ